MTRKTARTSVSICLVVAVLLTAGAAPAAASHEDGEDPFGGLITVDDEGMLTDIDIEWTEATSGAVRTYEKYTSDPGKASQYATAWTETYNANNDTIEPYVNERLNASTDYDVIAVHFHDRDGNNVTRYFVADVVDNNWTNSRFVSSTNRTVDTHVNADWYVSKNADDELEAFVTEYAEPGEPLSTAYKAKMIAEYGGGISSPIWNGSGR